MRETFAKSNQAPLLEFLPESMGARDEPKGKVSDPHSLYAAKCIEDLAFGPRSQMTQEELAKKAGVAGATLNGIRNLVKGAGPKSQRGIAKAMGLPLSVWQQNAEREYGSPADIASSERMPEALARVVDRRAQAGLPIAVEALRRVLEKRNLTGSGLTERQWDEILLGEEQQLRLEARILVEVSSAPGPSQDLAEVGPRRGRRR